jgi:xanthine/uracil permease
VTSEIETFRAELRAAGQPWSRRGVAFASTGIVLLALLQSVLLGFVRLPPAINGAILPIGGLSLALIAAGWAMLIVAVLRRRRWARTHDLTMPPLDVGEGRG